MTSFAFPTRRMVLRDMGKAGLAMLVLGATACSGEGADTSSATSASEEAPSTSPGVSPSTTDGASPRTGPTDSALQWQRVDLGFVSAYIIYRNGGAAVVDTGVADSEASIEAALTEVGLGWGSVGHVILTHKHPDHQGSLPAVLERAGAAYWYAGQGDIKAISADGGKPVGDDDSVFGLDVLTTPGHTPGHISLLDSPGGVLVAGDALNGSDGGVAGANPDFSEDMALANASVEKLATFDYEVALFGHGEPVLEGAAGAVTALAGTLGQG